MAVGITSEITEQWNDWSQNFMGLLGHSIPCIYYFCILHSIFLWYWCRFCGLKKSWVTSRVVNNRGISQKWLVKGKSLGRVKGSRVLDCGLLRLYFRGLLYYSCFL